MGILEEVTVDEPFYDVTTEDIAKRVHKNRAAYELKVKKKSDSNRAY